MPAIGNNYILVVFDSCRYDSFIRARPRVMRKLGAVERRWSYASWTAPSHFNLLMGLMPHLSPKHVFASDYYKKDFLRFNERLGRTDIQFKSLVPQLYLPPFLKNSLGYATHARVSLPVLNPKTPVNHGFDSFRLMDKHNDMRAMVREMHFSRKQPSFWLLNVGETHYPYALPDEAEEEWPHVQGVHGVFKHLDDHIVGGKLKPSKERFFNQKKLDELRHRQVLAVKYLDGVIEELFDIVPKNTYITITADHGELFGEDGYFGHGPILHEKVLEVPFLEGKLRVIRRGPSARSLSVREALQCAAALAGLAALIAYPHPAQMAYIGPGAGFAFLGSFLTLAAGLIMSVLSLLMWPFRMAWRAVRDRRSFRHARVKKIIFLGLDGLDPRLTERLLAEGKLPNLARLAAEGSYQRLRTTFPALSPVAWSTFATGVSPAKHNIFDFLDRSLKSYQPRLSSAHVGKSERVLRLGRFRIPLSRPSIELRRKSQPFWKILGKLGIGSTILRVPITFPPEKFDGKLLSAMATPDLKGTQGSFSQFTTRIEKATYENGSRYPLRRVADGFEGEIEGPEDTFVADTPMLRIPFRMLRRGGAFELHIAEQRCRLDSGEYTGWQRLRFRTAIGASVHGMARFLLTETEPECSLYMSPINIDPERPALPISHPSYYAVYLANLLGSFATVGMAEDTWALNEGVIGEDAFLEQAYGIFAEREAMFLNALETTRRGVVACVFDTSDRIQHMFYRHMGGADRHAAVIEEMYQRMDVLAGKVIPFVDSNTALFVLSDHGFCSFRRGVNINSWLRDNGYLHLQNGDRESGSFFAGVDWSRTRAYGLGLGGFYLNMKDREARGIVAATDAAALKQEIIAKLAALRDEDGATPIRTVYETAALYRGPYLEAAPDFIVGYNEGYRCSWEGAVGKVEAAVLVDNPKAWSGDHCVDPVLVPGVLFSNRKIGAEDPGIEDLAPTALNLFGVPPPAWMEGKPLL